MIFLVEEHLFLVRHDLFELGFLIHIYFLSFLVGGRWQAAQDITL